MLATGPIPVARPQPAKSPNHIIVVETSHFSVSSRLVFVHKYPEHGEGVGSDSQAARDPEAGRSFIMYGKGSVRYRCAKQRTGP